MSTAPTISLKPNQLYDIGGKSYTLEELQQNAIDAETYRKAIRELSQR